MRNDWWFTNYAKGGISKHMTGGGQGLDHPSRGLLLEQIPEGSSVIDVGCCNALMLQGFKDANKRIDYTGVDQIPEFIEYDKENYPEATFAVSDASDLRDFADGQFDYAVSRHVIDHLNHYSQHFIELYRVCKKKMIVITWRQLWDGDKEVLHWGSISEGGNWDNRYNHELMDRFISRELNPLDYEIIPNYEETGNSVIIVTKEI